MDENKENRISRSINDDAILNFGAKQEENEFNVDLEDIMRMTTNLMQNEFIMNSVKELGQFLQLPMQNHLLQNWMDTEWIVISKDEMQKVVNELIDVRKELAEVLEVSKSLLEELKNERAKNKGE
jgi:hypothetical protein